MIAQQVALSEEREGTEVAGVVTEEVLDYLPGPRGILPLKRKQGPGVRLEVVRPLLLDEVDALQQLAFVAILRCSPDAQALDQGILGVGGLDVRSSVVEAG